MLSKPKIAVIVICYNLGRTLEETVDSILIQSRPAAEILIVDDGSTDIFTKQILKRLKRPKTQIQTIHHQGVATARNYGVSLTKAPYIILLDADDMLAPTCLEKLGECLDTDRSIDFVSSGVQAFEGASYKWFPPSTTAVGTLTRGSVHISTMLRRSLWDALDGFDTELEGYEDLDFWLNAIRLGFKGKIIDEPLLMYRVRNGSRYENSLAPETYNRIMHRIIDRHRPLIEEHGLDVLYEKENFFNDIAEYRDSLMSEQKKMINKLNKINDEIKTLTDNIEGKLGYHGIASFITSKKMHFNEEILQSEVQEFLERWRWLIHGSISVISDIDKFIDTLVVPRWDNYNTTSKETRLPLSKIDSIQPISQDCIIALLSSSLEQLDYIVGFLKKRLKPGGCLLITVPAFHEWKSIKISNGFHPSDSWLRNLISRVFPLDAFDVEVSNTITSAICRTGENNLIPFRKKTFINRRLPTGTGIVLVYHRIADINPDIYGISVCPHHFRQHMRYLKDHFTVMPLLELFFAARDGALPPRAVAVTFDDGYLDALTNAAPVLKDEGICGTFFINTERIHEPHFTWNDEIELLLMNAAPVANIELRLPNGFINIDFSLPEQRIYNIKTLYTILWQASAENRQDVLQQLREKLGNPILNHTDRRLLTADEVIALANIGCCEIGSHSEHHLVLNKHDEATQRNELVKSKKTLEEILGRPIVSFSYPYGEYDTKLSQIVAETPYLIGVTVEAGTLSINTNPMLIPRLEIKNFDEMIFAKTLECFFTDEQYRKIHFHISEERPDRNKRNIDIAFETNDQIREKNEQMSRKEYSEGAIKLKAMPQFLIIDPTSRCNARCVMCPVSFRQSGDKGTDLDINILKELLPLLPAAANVNLFSTGEPTLADNIEWLLDIVKERTGDKTSICMSTNGKHIKDGVLKRMLSPKMVLQFSIDGGTKDVFESIRRGIKFEEICHSLEAAKKARGINPYPLFWFSSTISKRNLHDLINIFELAKKYSINHIFFYEEDPEVFEEEIFSLGPEDKATFEAQLSCINNTNIPYSNGLYFRGKNGLRASNPPPTDKPFLQCSAPWKVFHLKADGTVRTCCTLRHSMGDMQFKTYEDVWNGDEYTKLRRAFVEQTGIPETCYRCTDPLRTYGL